MDKPHQDEEIAKAENNWKLGDQ